MRKIASWCKNSHYKKHSFLHSHETYVIQCNLDFFSKEQLFTIMIDSDFLIINVQKVKACKFSSRECFSYFPLFFLKEFPCVFLAHKIAIWCKNKLYIKQSILHSDLNNSSRKFKTHPRKVENYEFQPFFAYFIG